MPGATTTASGDAGSQPTPAPGALARRRESQAPVLFLLMLAVLLVAETFSVAILDRWRTIPFPEKVALDLALTLALLFPVLYWLSFRPLARQVAETRRAEELARRETGRLLALLDALPAYVYLRDASLSVRLVNRQFRERFGEPGQARCFEVLGEQQRCLECVAVDVLSTGMPAEFDWTASDGRSYRVFGHPFTDQDGSPLGLYLGLDVTRRKRAEEALREVNEALDRRVGARTAELEAANRTLAAERGFIAAVLDTAGALVVVLDSEGRIERFNRACESATGYRFEEVRGRCVWELLLTSEEASGVQAVFASLAAGAFPLNHENDWVARDGTTRRIAWSNTVIKGAAGAVEHVIGTGVDVTEQRRAEAEAARRAAEAEAGRRTLETLMDHVPEGIAIADAPGIGLRAMSRYGLEFLGVSAEEIRKGTVEERGRILQVHDATGSRALPVSEWPLTRAVRGGELVAGQEVMLRRHDGTMVPFLCHAGPIRDHAGSITGGVVVWRDITELRRQQAERTRHLERLDMLIDSSRRLLQETTMAGLLEQLAESSRKMIDGRVGVSCCLDPTGAGRIEAVSRAQPASAVDERTLAAALCDCVWPRLGETRQSLRLQQPGACQLPSGACPEGVGRPCDGIAAARLIGRDGQPCGLVAVVGKTHGELTAEDEAHLLQLTTVGSLCLRHIEARTDAERRADELDTVFAAMTDGVVVFDVSGHATRANPAARASLGLNPTGAALDTVLDRLQVRGAGRSPVAPDESATGRALRGETVRGVREELTTPSGQAATILVSSSPLRSRGKLAGAVTVWHDVSELERATASLARSEAEFEAIFRAIADAAIVTDLERRIATVNPAFTAVFGYPEAEIVGQTTELLYADRTAFERLGREAYNPDAAPSTAPYQMHYRRKDGSTFWAESTGVRVTLPDGQPVGFLGIHRDITERRRAEELLRASLEEKVVLLKEVHHRVKNNLQIIASMLSLQSSRLRGESAAGVLRESQNRVRTIALVHEKLYLSRDLARISVRAYLQDLASSILDSYSGGGLIGLELEVEDLHLPVDLAIPLALIANELISNCVKHAFGPGRAGTIRVTLASSPPRRLTLVVADDGAGLPETVDPAHTESLGLRLVHVLAAQLGGTVAVSRRPGATVAVTFEAPESEVSHG